MYSRRAASAVAARPRRRRLLGACAGALVASAIVVCVVSLASAVALGFPDVPASDPHSAAINELASRNIIGGYGDGDFGPGDPITRQQFAKMVVLTCSYPVSESDVCPFTDVQRSGAASLYPDNYVAVCAAKGISVGKTAALFDPYSDITRYEVVTMLVRAADDLDPHLLAAPPADWVGNATWAGDATHGTNAARAEYNGLLAGLDLPALNPSGKMNRGETAQVLYNLLGKLGKIPSSTTTTVPPTTTTLPITTVVPEDFESLGGAISSAPAACSQTSGLLDVFARGANGTVVHKSWNGTSWSEWEDLGGAMKPGSDPAAASSGLDRVDVLIRGTDDALWHRWWNGASWSDWETLGGVLASSPAATYQEDSIGRKWLDVYVLDPNGRLQHRILDGTVWEPWAPVALTGLTFKPGLSPAVVSWGGRRIDLFACGPDDVLWHAYLPPGGPWSDPQMLTAQSTSSPSVSTWGSWAEDRLDLFLRGADYCLWHETLVSGLWSDWERVGAEAVASAPAAVSWAPDHIDLFVRGTDNALWHRAWTGSRWWP